MCPYNQVCIYCVIDGWWDMYLICIAHRISGAGSQPGHIPRFCGGDIDGVKACAIAMDPAASRRTVIHMFVPDRRWTFPADGDPIGRPPLGLAAPTPDKADPPILMKSNNNSSMTSRWRCPCDVLTKRFSHIILNPAAGNSVFGLAHLAHSIHQTQFVSIYSQSIIAFEQPQLGADTFFVNLCRGRSRDLSGKRCIGVGVFDV